jgi:curved DNA-binding protein CbpA
MDHFKNLGLAEDASLEEVKAAYYRLAKEHHPDANKLPGAAEKFKLICTSYEILKNEEKRAKYILEKGYGGGEEEWNRGYQQHRTNYNDVRADFDRASDKMKSEHRYKFKLMAMFEHLIHPRTLFVVVPTGVFTYWVMSSVFSRNKGTIKDDNRNPEMTVAAWKNPKTNRYELPAPWDDEYKKYIATTPLVHIDRSLVARDPKQ